MNYMQGWATKKPKKRYYWHLLAYTELLNKDSKKLMNWKKDQNKMTFFLPV